MKAVHFGAGNIGRGFIGKLLIESGYYVTFVDVVAETIRLLNETSEYPVIVIGEEDRVEVVKGYKALLIHNAEAVIAAIAESDVITTAVGKEALTKIAPFIAKGLAVKLKACRVGEWPVHLIVIACENVNDNTSYLASLVEKYLSPEEWKDIAALVSFPNCVVDRIIPNVSREKLAHPLAVAVEEYAHFAIDGNAIPQGSLVVAGVEISTNLRGLLEQKLFTLNMAHAIIGYYGYLAGLRYVHEALADPRVTVLLEGAFGEVGRVLEAQHGISEDEHAVYVAKTLKRLGNPKLSDEIIRVARQPKRKLHPSDRLVAPATRALEHGIMPSYLATGIAGALAYDYAGDDQARELVSELRQKGVDAVLAETASLSPHHDLARLVKSDFIFQSLSRR